MGRDRRAFALMTALITASAVFAAALSLAALSRSAVIESGALTRSIEAELRARTAAARVVAGVVGEAVSQSGEPGAEDPSEPDGPEIDTDELPEMPEFMREFLEEYLDDPAEEEDEEGNVVPKSQRRSSAERGVRRLRARGLPARSVAVVVDGVPLRVTMTDALGVVNVNRATLEELAALFEGVGAEPYDAESIAAQLIDYRDADDFVTPRGAENADYLRRGLVIRNASLEAVEELLYLASMTPDIFSRVRPLVTVHGDGKLHAPSAPEAALAVVPGVGASGARAIVALREAGTLDAESLRDALSLFAGEAASRFRFEPSPVIRVRIEPEGDGPVFTATAAVTDQGVRWGPFEQE